jgi:hypothetical protein
MDYEILLNKQKHKKNIDRQNNLDNKMKMILDIIDSIDEHDLVLEKTKIKDDTDIISSFKTLIISYSNLKKQLSIENEKHTFIISIVNNILNKSLNEIELLEKSTNNNQLKKITNCILEDSTKKTIKLNLIKS